MNKITKPNKRIVRKKMNKITKPIKRIVRKLEKGLNKFGNSKVKTPNIKLNKYLVGRRMRIELRRVERNR